MLLGETYLYNHMTFTIISRAKSISCGNFLSTRLYV